MLVAEGVTVGYGSVTAVRAASLSVREGEVLGIVGPNGAGKSSLLTSLAGLVRHAEGKICLAGQDVGHLTPERRARLGLSYVPEGRGLLPPLSVADNLGLGAYSSGRISRRALSERLEEAYDLFPVLKDRKNQRSGTLSGGEAAMLALARALMSRPGVLLLDEPTLGLAPLAAERVFEAVGSLVAGDNGPAVVLVEEKARGLLAVADRVGVMKHGEFRDFGSSVTHAEVERAYFGSG